LSEIESVSPTTNTGINSAEAEATFFWRAIGQSIAEFEKKLGALCARIDSEVEHTAGRYWRHCLPADQ
jgi:hypothetical protein